MIFLNFHRSYTFSEGSSTEVCGLEGSFIEGCIFLEGSSTEVYSFLKFNIFKNSLFWKEISSEIEILLYEFFFQFLFK